MPGMGGGGGGGFETRDMRASVADEGEAITKRHMERSQLARAWDIQQRTTADDWRDWMRTLSLTLLKESPSVALHYCSYLAERSQPLRLELFNAAFASCWDELGHLEEHERRALGGRRLSRGAGSGHGPGLGGPARARAPPPTWC